MGRVIILRILSINRYRIVYPVHGLRLPQPAVSAALTLAEVAPQDCLQPLICVPILYRAQRPRRHHHVFLRQLRCLSCFLRQLNQRCSLLRWLLPIAIPAITRANMDFTLHLKQWRAIIPLHHRCIHALPFRSDQAAHLLGPLPPLLLLVSRFALVFQ